MELGRPPVPALVLDGRTTTILHVSQIASLLGIPVDLPAGGPATAQRFAWDTATILASWTEVLAQVDWDTLLEPTASRGRSIRNLTVNTFHPFELLPDAFARGRFLWYPERDDEREAVLESRARLSAYANGVRSEWEQFLADNGDEIANTSRRVSGPRGELSFAALLESQRWHAAWHYRQVIDHCRRRGVEMTSCPSPAVVDDIGLPESIY